MWRILMLNADLIVGISSFVLGGILYFSSRGLSKLGGIFVNYVLVAIFLLAAVMFVKGLIKPEKLAFFESVIERNNILIGIIILFLYLIIMPWIGFLISSYIFYFAFNTYLAENRWSNRNILQSMALSAIVVTFFYIIFHHVLQVPLPVGSFFE